MPVAYNMVNGLPGSNINDSNKYCLELARLNSFTQKWPHADHSPCSKEVMSKAGFFYLGYSDCVRCFVCHITLENWDIETDEPWLKHLEVSPRCMFADFGLEEANLTVEQWVDVLCGRTINLFDNRLNKLIEVTTTQKVHLE